MPTIGVYLSEETYRRTLSQAELRAMTGSAFIQQIIEALTEPKEPGRSRKIENLLSGTD